MHFLSSEQVIEAQRLFKEVVVPVMTQEHSDEDGRSGAVLNLRDCTNSLKLHIRKGTAPEEKFKAYSDNAIGKNDALDDYPEHQTSWEVHRGDVAHVPYPGAIRTPHDDRVSISGFTWQRDTVGSLWIAYKLGRIGLVDASVIAEICGIKMQFIRTVKKLNSANALAIAA